MDDDITSSTFDGTTGDASTSGCTTGGWWGLINFLWIRSWIIMYHDLVNASMPANGIDKIFSSFTIFFISKLFASFFALIKVTSASNLAA
jgi:hypothetical protein